jgi:hypothetical protein
MLVFAQLNEISEPVALRVSVGNRSNQPAFHVIVQVGIDADLVLRTTGDFQQTGTRIDERGQNHHWLSRRMSSPPELPLFREADPWPGMFAFGVRSRHAASSEFYVTTIVQTPGFEDKQHWVLRSRGAVLTLYGPITQTS